MYKLKEYIKKREMTKVEWKKATGPWKLQYGRFDSDFPDDQTVTNS